MAALLKNVTNSIWHAFNALPQEKPGYVNKTKLKVLTANIATILDSYGVEKGLEHYRSTASLNFQHFRYYLLQEVFTQLDNTITLTELRNYEGKIEEICWLVCRKNYQITQNDINDDILYKLFRIFCMLSDLDINDITEQCKVHLHVSEACHLIQELMSSIGLDYEADEQFNSLANGNIISLSFEEFLDILQFKDYTLSDLSESLKEVIEEMYETLINDIIKKGFLLRRGYLLPSMKEYWFVLQPRELTFYKNHNQKDISGTILLDETCTVSPSPATPGKQDKFLKFILSVGERNIELAAHDHKSRLQWITSLQLAITYSIGKEGFQRELVARRRKRREEAKIRRQEENLLLNIHSNEVEIAKLQLKEEKLARLAAESQARTLQRVVHEDSRRVAELEDIKITLEKLLKDETQAKRDEEIVRALQARVLTEEWEKREELERLQDEQRSMFEKEREKRIQFEKLQKEKEQQLREAENKLKELEEERQRLDKELKHARIKIMHSEETKQILEARLQLICPPPRGDRIRRALSFMHSSRDQDFVDLSDVRSSIRSLSNIKKSEKK